MFKQIKNNDGSVLIVVLWTLIMVGYLVGDYLIHNRAKTGTAMNLMLSFDQMNAVESVLNLTTSDKWKSGIDAYTLGTWVDLDVEGVKLRFRLDNESGRININTADDAKIRQAMVDILGESGIEKAPHLTDAILDWKDTDDLVRTHGAEKEYYDSEGRYGPGDGWFKTMTELLLVKGITPHIFWGDPGKDDPLEEESTDEEPIDVEPIDVEPMDDTKEMSLLDRVTIFNSGIERLSILIPLKGETRLYVVLFLKGKKSLEVVERYTQIIGRPN